MPKRTPAIIVFSIVCLAWICLCVYNIWKNPGFFTVSAGIMLQTGMVVLVSYFLVQYNSDVKQQMKLSEDFIHKLVDSYASYMDHVSAWIAESITDANEKKVVWQQVNQYGRRVTNYISFLKKMPLKKADKELLENISDEWETIHDRCTSVVNNDPEKDEIHRQLERFKLLLDEKTDNLITNLYT